MTHNCYGEDQAICVFVSLSSERLSALSFSVVYSFAGNFNESVCFLRLIIQPANPQFTDAVAR